MMSTHDEYEEALAGLKKAGYEPVVLPGLGVSPDRLVGFAPPGSTVARDDSDNLVITVPAEAWESLP